ncbi:trace amine-associated receptor 1-like [Mastacembelus armatus]|uniref:trace amine-associated receptor 1-like n=1 Tax=Mastacembelus armatus TaxID=205130 RepID=UPI000E460231|nr:trace amine-associated receptor 1-like [Mastacembelus armatus]
MKMKISNNRSDVFSDIHPCYKIDASYLLSSNPSSLCALFHIFLGSLSVVTVCGNLLVIISIIYFKQLHTPTNSLVLSLAVTDLLVGVLVYPLTMEFSISSCLYNNGLFCKVRGTFDVSLCTSSILNLCCISVDRYHAVCQPLTYRTKINHHVVVTMILVSWGVAVLIGLGFLVLGMTHNLCSETCIIDIVTANIMGLLFAFYLPMIVMLCIYLKIFLVAQRQARSIQNTKSGATVNKMERKATKTLAIVMGVFLMCWLPFYLCTTILSFSHVYVPLVLLELLNWLALSNSLLNPFIYAFFYRWFRSAFRIVISGKILQGDFTNSKLL